MPADNGEILAIVAGGGPAPGINGVISAATIEAINNGMNVIGIYNGFKWLARYNITPAPFYFTFSLRILDELS